ncbi:MAG: hypothetical protein AAF799_05220 [Myxococcota bacterium]
MQDDLTAINDADHWMGWLGDDPGRAIRDAIERGLQQQVADAKLVWLRFGPDPHFLTGGRRSPDDEGKVIVTRSAVAVAFELEVDDGSGSRHQLRGSFSWVVGGLDQGDDRTDRVFFELDTELSDAKETLEQRLYSLDDEG